MNDMETRINQAKKPTGDLGKATLERMNQSHESLTLWALDLLKEKTVGKKIETILDVGCGGGATLSRLLNQYTSATVYGVDYSSEGVALSKEFNKAFLGSRCHIQEGSVLELPYEERQFSLVTAFETIYFWQDYPKALAEIKRVLCENGIFLVCCEMSNPEEPRWQEALPHMNLLTGEGWEMLLKDNGFANVTLYKAEGEWICLLVENK